MQKRMAEQLAAMPEVQPVPATEPPAEASAGWLHQKLLPILNSIEEVSRKVLAGGQKIRECMQSAGLRIAAVRAREIRTIP
jgi:hypothetical protein